MCHKDVNRRRTFRGRALSLFLAAVLLLGTAPGLTMNASAANWADPYLDQLVDWGVMRADQIKNPDSQLTRAEFMAIINRAYGYKEVGPMPFTDVKKSDWFYDDVAIAYTAGYMNGTSGTTASPNLKLTREQAVCILGRNMMLKETPGEDLAFTDSRSISGWARGMVKTAVNNYIVTGYSDNAFHPKDYVTKGQMAALVTRCIGTPVSKSGTYELGDVAGNVTVTAPNVTLRNTTVSGDLYVSGGVGLGGVKLENVNVLGRIVVSGTGESENGSASVVMRNVNANELLVDNMRKKYVTVRADGITEIARTTVRTNAYLEDNNTDEKGLLNISLEGDPGARLDLAGRIKKVVDKTRDSFIQVAKGSVQSLTVDEEATNAVIQINRNTQVKELNLDVAANVNGEGDVGRLNINAPGSTVTMLPDDIYIRPGITGNVNGVVMDSAAAEESSLDPRLLAGYPAASDVAPTGFRADFSGNKKGTVYWAVSSISDGSIGADALISPPSYGSKAVRSGSVGLPAGNTVGSTQISGLTVGGSYYLSAVLVDGRGERSPVKVISFTTPDNTVPAFAQGYPYMSLVSNNLAQVTVMPTKTCKLYYAVLLKGAKAPTASEMRSASVTGNLGYGVVDVVKNTERVINVSNRLQELKDYTLYLWLSDADGVNSSAVIPVQFKTVDKTPPEFDPDPDPNNAVEEDTSVKLTAGLNEPGTIYWVAVEKGKAYPPTNYANLDDNDLDPETKLPVSAKLTSEYAKNQVKNHKGTVAAYGSVAVAKADTEVTINVTKLKESSTYDFYYVAQDKANNFSREVKKITIRTRDTVGPVVTQYFRDTTRGEAVAVPRAVDEIVLKFNEDIKVGGMGGLLDLNKTNLEKTLKGNFVLKYVDDRGNPVKVESTAELNYAKAVVRKVDDGIEMALDPAKGAIKLVSGREYFFELSRITDLSDNAPKGMTAEATLRYDKVTGTEHVLPKFIVAPASVKLSEPSVNQISPQPVWVGNPNETAPINAAGKEGGGKKQGDAGKDTDVGKELARVDGRFYVDPESTKDMGNTYYYDILLFSEKAIDYDIYYRVLDPKNEYTALKSAPTGGSSGVTRAETLKFEDYRIREDDVTDNEGWAYLGNVKSRKTGANSRDVSGVSRDAERTGYTAEMNNLRLLNTLGQDVRYEFAVSVTKLGGSANYSAWGDRFKVHVSVIAGARERVDRVIRAGNSTEETVQKADGISVISDPFYITMGFSEFDAPPAFTEGPSFEPDYNGTPTAKIKFGLDNPGTLYYVIVPKNSPIAGTDITTKKGVGKSTEAGYIAVDTNIKSGMDLTGFTWPDGTENRDRTWQNLLWRVVAQQTGTTNPGRLNDSGHLEYYSAAAPTADKITTDRYMHWISYSRTDGRAETTFLEYDGEMEEGQEYYIYLVLGSDNSERKSAVYIYNFTSGVTERPKMLLNQNGKDFTVETNKLGRPYVNTELDWRIFHRNDALTKLRGTFIVSGSDGPSSYPGVTSMLDALSTTFSSDVFYTGSDITSRKFGTSYDGFTVFDVLASDSDKDYVYNLIIGNNPGLTVYGYGNNCQTKNYSWKDNWYNIVKRDYPEENIEKGTYLILVGGHSQLSEQKEGESFASKNSFRALPNVSLASKTAPQLQDVLGSVNLRKDASGKWMLSGTVNLQFEPDKEVYWRETTDGPYYRVTGGSRGPSGSEAEDNLSVGLLYNAERGNPFTDATGSSTYFSLPFEGVTENHEYTLLPGGAGFYAKDGNDPGGPLVIRFTISSTKTEKDPDDPNGVLKYREGKWEVTYRTSNVTRTVGSRTVKVYEEEAGTAAPTPPWLDSANVTFTGPMGSSDLKAKVELQFKSGNDGNLYFKTASGFERVTDITAGCIVDPNNKGVTVTKDGNPYGGKYTVNVSFGSMVKDDKVVVVLLSDKDLYEKTGEAYTDDMIRIEISIVPAATGFAGQALGKVEVYFGSKRVCSETQSRS